MRAIGTRTVIQGAILVAVLLAAYGLGRRAGRGPQSGAAPVARPSPPSSALRPSPHRAGYLGVVLADRSVDVAAPSAGQLEAISVRVGDRVAAGAVVARLNARRLAKDLAMAEASARRSRAEREQARLEGEQARDRTERLERLAREAGLVSEQDVVAARYQQQGAAAHLVAAEAAVQQEEQRVAQLVDALSEAELKAPFGGVVAARYVNAGSTVAAGERLLRIITSGKPLVRFAIPEEDRSAIAVGRRVSLRVDGSDLRLGAQIVSVAPDVDPSSQMIFVEALVSEPLPATGTVIIGRAARVSVAGDS
jgi:RND family efflux transporter MFP subunit